MQRQLVQALKDARHALDLERIELYFQKESAIRTASGHAQVIRCCEDRLAERWTLEWDQNLKLMEKTVEVSKEREGDLIRVREKTVEERARIVKKLREMLREL